MNIQKAIIMEQKDNVATLLSGIEEGSQVQIEIGEGDFTVQAKEPISYGHKIALKDIEKGGEVIKYGEVIGRAIDHIIDVSFVHAHNTESLSAGNL